MAFLIGYIGTPFLIAFLIVRFGLKEGYEKKHGAPMSTGQMVGRTIGIGILILCICLFGHLV
ncbi:MAG: hypothetical protein K2K56_11890 [Lachnospiraceae bacterium]|nr:hypothetical protein [Lachnospiraceae bacterium]